MDERGRGAVVVTGAAGFIGRHVTRLLAADPSRPVVAVDVRPDDPMALDPSGAPVLRWAGDVGAAGVLGRLRRLEPAAIVHLAAETNSMIRDRNHMIEQNVGTFDRVLDAAEAVGARVVFASSAAVYGNGPVPMRESQQPRPHNPYAHSKLLMERSAEQARQRGLSVLGLRFFNVYGAGEAHKGRSASMVFQVHRALSRGEPARVFRDGSHRRDFVHVADVAAAVVAAVGSAAQGVLNVGSGQPTTFNELIDVVAAEAGVLARVEYLDEPDWEYQRETWACLDAARGVLPLRPRPLVDGVRELVATAALAPIGRGRP